MLRLKRRDVKQSGEVRMAKLKEASKKATNCKQCNKRLSKKKWYYRNGNYFCSYRCWKKFDLKQKQEKEQKKETKES